MRGMGARCHPPYLYKMIRATETVKLQRKTWYLRLQGASGEGEWERAISLIDFNFTRPSGTDLTRLKGVLFAAKGRTVAAN